MGAERETPTPKARRMTGAERRQRIIEATVEIVAEHGVQGATTARIAAAAGISEKTLYSHFASRHDMLIAALDAVFARSRVAWAHPVETDALEHLRRAVEDHWPSEQEFVYPLFEFFASPPQAGLRQELRARHETSIGLLADIIEEGKTQGVIRPDIDSEQVTWEFMSIYWAEDVAYMLGFDEFASSGRSKLMLDRLLREITNQS
jgi:TetR/AcrR family transcriptional regulator, regulator of biofilm formation and stress response